MLVKIRKFSDHSIPRRVTRLAWRRGFFALAIVVLAPLVAAAESPEEIAAILAAESEVVRSLLAAYPRMPEQWREDYWPDALLRGKSLPDSPWRSHDLRRPQPARADSDEISCDSTPPPDGAFVLFDGGNLSQWSGTESEWRVDRGSLQPLGRSPNRLESKQAFGDVRIHLEFASPSPPTGHWQYRGNSGVFLMGLYEVQILDSWDNPVYPDGQMGAVYGQFPPLLNASLPPGEWQCLDIWFTAPRFDEAGVVPARVTAEHNGVRIHDNVALYGPTGFVGWGEYEPHPARLPLGLQDHGDGPGTRFRNIWVVDGELNNHDG